MGEKGHKKTGTMRANATEPHTTAEMVDSKSMTASVTVVEPKVMVPQEFPSGSMTVGELLLEEANDRFREKIEDLRRKVEKRRRELNLHGKIQWTTGISD